MTKNRLLAIINKSDSACALVKLNGCILFYNDAFTNLFNSDIDNILKAFRGDNNTTEQINSLIKSVFKNNRSETD
jgi:RIO-like serine/threonine protein kinase